MVDWQTDERRTKDFTYKEGRVQWQIGRLIKEEGKKILTYIETKVYRQIGRPMNEKRNETSRVKKGKCNGRFVD